MVPDSGIRAHVRPMRNRPVRTQPPRVFAALSVRPSGLAWVTSDPLAKVATVGASDENRDAALEDLTREELEEELARLASHIYAGTCRWLELVGELDRRCGWAESGCGSCAEWIAWRCALLPRAAREHVRVARRLSGLPLVHAAFSRGELSYAKVRALTRVAEEACERELLELARCLTAAQLERALRAYRRVTREEAQEVHEREYLTTYWDEDGSLVVHGRLAPEEGALLLRGLEAARDSLWEAHSAEPGGSAEPRTPTSTGALARMADMSLTGGDAERSGGERYQVVVHVDLDALSFDDGGGCELDEGPVLASETARRLSCDASVIRISERNGRTLNVGRKTRTIAPGLRRALKARDHGCRFPGCEKRRFVDAHHVEHWARGGETKIDNLLLLCRRHHRLVHEGGYGLERLPGGRVRFRLPCGTMIPDAPRPPPATGKRLAASKATCWSGDGDAVDLGLSVDALLQAVG